MTATHPLASLFLELIALDAVSGMERSVAEYIVRYLRHLGFQPYIDDTASLTGSNTGNLLCPINGGGNMVLLCHLDTARSTKEVKPLFHSDRVTSDGTTVLGVDNRAGIAALLFAVREAVNQGIPLRPCTLAFTTCEETTLLGSQSLKLDDSITTGFVFDSYLPTGSFVNESCGAVALNIEIRGKASHSGIAPEKGVNVIQIGVEALSHFPFGRTDADTTANIGIIKGGTATNVVPDLLQMEGEIRSKDAAKVERIAEEIKRCFELYASRYKGSADVAIRWDFRPYRIEAHEPVYKEVERVMGALGLEAKACLSWGGSDANSLNEKGIRTVNLGIGAQNPHSNEEFILYTDLENSGRIALELMKIGTH
jgi:tripeptide aminopeptidase